MWKRNPSDCHTVILCVSLCEIKVYLWLIELILGEKLLSYCLCCSDNDCWTVFILCPQLFRSHASHHQSIITMDCGHRILSSFICWMQKKMYLKAIMISCSCNLNFAKIPRMSSYWAWAEWQWPLVYLFFLLQLFLRKLSYFQNSWSQYYHSFKYLIVDHQTRYYQQQSSTKTNNKIEHSFPPPHGLWRSTHAFKAFFNFILKFINKF